MLRAEADDGAGNSVAGMREKRTARRTAPPRAPVANGAVFNQARVYASSVVQRPATPPPTMLAHAPAAPAHAAPMHTPPPPQAMRAPAPVPAAPMHAPPPPQAMAPRAPAPAPMPAPAAAPMPAQAPMPAAAPAPMAPRAGAPPQQQQQQQHMPRFASPMHTISAPNPNLATAAAPATTPAPLPPVSPLSAALPQLAADDSVMSDADLMRLMEENAKLRNRLGLKPLPGQQASQ